MDQNQLYHDCFVFHYGLSYKTVNFIYVQSSIFGISDVSLPSLDCRNTSRNFLDRLYSSRSVELPSHKMDLDQQSSSSATLFQLQSLLDGQWRGRGVY